MNRTSVVIALQKRGHLRVKVKKNRDSSRSLGKPQQWSIEIDGDYCNFSYDTLDEMLDAALHSTKATCKYCKKDYYTEEDEGFCSYCSIIDDSIQVLPSSIELPKHSLAEKPFEKLTQELRDISSGDSEIISYEDIEEVTDIFLSRLIRYELLNDNPITIPEKTGIPILNKLYEYLQKEYFNIIRNWDFIRGKELPRYYLGKGMGRRDKYNERGISELSYQWYLETLQVYNELRTSQLFLDVWETADIQTKGLSDIKHTLQECVGLLHRENNGTEGYYFKKLKEYAQSHIENYKEKKIRADLQKKYDEDRALKDKQEVQDKLIKAIKTQEDLKLKQENQKKWNEGEALLARIAAKEAADRIQNPTPKKEELTELQIATYTIIVIGLVVFILSCFL